MSEKPKTLEELRKALVAELGAFQMTMFRTDTSDEEVAEFEAAVRADERTKIRNDAEPCYFVPYSTLAPKVKP